jgi:DNA invertase Pin-like site-specific DNA recombinase
VDGRDALKRLIDDVQAGTADFNVILVYDVSRWGRFQDADESAYYEFICKEAGIAVHYCAEQFENDGSLSATIIKGMKRAMAGEYSRELSTKVFAGQCRLITLGFRQGGNAGCGLRRQLIDEHRQPKGELTARNAEEPANRSPSLSQGRLRKSIPCDECITYSSKGRRSRKSRRG